MPRDQAATTADQTCGDQTPNTPTASSALKVVPRQELLTLLPPPHQPHLSITSDPRPGMVPEQSLPVENLSTAQHRSL